MKGGEAIVRVLEKLGISHIFGVPGSEFIYTLDNTGNGVEFISTHSESLAGGATHGFAYAKKNQLPGICMVTKAPGFLNVTGSMASAYEHCIPAVCIATSADYKYTKNRNRWQNVDVVGMAPHFSKGGITAALWGNTEGEPNIVEALTIAIKNSLNGFPGPFILNVPKNILEQEIPDNDIKWPTPDDIKPNNPEPQDKYLKQLYDMLSQAKKPVLIVGNESTHRFEEITALAKKYGASVYGTFMHLEQKLDNPAYAGTVGYVNTPEVTKQITEESDCIVFIGSRGHEKDMLDFHQGLSFDALLDDPISGKPKKQISFITPEDFRGDETVYYNLNVAGNIDQTFEYLQAQNHELSKEAQDWQRKNHEEYASYINKNVPFKDKDSSFENVNMQEVMRVLSKNFGPETFFMFSTSAAFTYGPDIEPDKTQGQEVLGATESMGQRFGAGIGYALATGKKMVMIMGDGDALLNGQILEMATAKKLGLDVTMIVVDNKGHGAIIGAQARGKISGQLEKQAGEATLREDDIDFSGLMKALGADKITEISDGDNIKVKLSEIFKPDSKVKTKGIVVKTAIENPARGVVFAAGTVKH